MSAHLDHLLDWRDIKTEAVLRNGRQELRTRLEIRIEELAYFPC